MKANLSFDKNSFLDNGTSVPYNVRYYHSQLGPCSEYYYTKLEALNRMKELEDIDDTISFTE